MKLNLLAPPAEAKGVWVDPNRCVHFSVCIAVQSTDCSAIFQPIARSVPSIKLGECNACGDCVKSCPRRAIRYVI